MPTKPALDLKATLRNIALPALAARAPYFSVSALRNWLNNRRIVFSPATLNRYLAELKAAGIIFDAGRGWYSFLDKPVLLDPALVSELADVLRREFPLLRFVVWSTAQMNPWLHHLVGNPISFVLAERSSLEAVSERLRDLNWDVHLNPRGESARHFTSRKRSVVVRPLHHEWPAAVMVEPVLVEFRLEAEALQLVPMAEFRAAATQLVTSGRVELSTLLNYAAERKLSAIDLFQESIIAVFQEKRL